jgi:hypothetical protein
MLVLECECWCESSVIVPLRYYCSRIERWDVHRAQKRTYSSLVRLLIFVHRWYTVYVQIENPASCILVLRIGLENYGALININCLFTFCTVRSTVWSTSRTTYVQYRISSRSHIHIHTHIHIRETWKSYSYSHLFYVESSTTCTQCEYEYEYDFS